MACQHLASTLFAHEVKSTIDEFAPVPINSHEKRISGSEPYILYTWTFV